MAGDLLERLYRFLATRSTLTLATIGPDGAPLAAPLFFAADQSLNLYFVSSPDSRHSLALATRLHVAVSVYTETWDWREIQGLQMEGTARSLARAARDAALAVYTAKFPFVAGMRPLLDASTFHSIAPDWIRWIDNTRGFGYREEWRRPV